MDFCWQSILCLPVSLLFNMLSRLVRALLPRSKRLFISWLQSLSAVILEAKKLNKKRKKERKIFKKSFTVSVVHSITSQCSSYHFCIPLIVRTCFLSPHCNFLTGVFYSLMSRRKHFTPSLPTLISPLSSPDSLIHAHLTWFLGFLPSQFPSSDCSPTWECCSISHMSSDQVRMLWVCDLLTTAMIASSMPKKFIITS